MSKHRLNAETELNHNTIYIILQVECNAINLKVTFCVTYDKDLLNKYVSALGFCNFFLLKNFLISSLKFYIESNKNECW